jgi:phosphopantetheinyl transferase
LANHVDADSRAEENRVSNPNLVLVHRAQEDAPFKRQALIQAKTTKHPARQTSRTQEQKKSLMRTSRVFRRLLSNSLMASAWLPTLHMKAPCKYSRATLLGM